MKPALAPFLALLAIGAGWGATTPMIKTATMAGYGPFGIMLWQMCVSLVVLLVVQGLRGRVALPLGRADLQLYAVVAMFGMVVPHFFSYTAVGRLPSGVMSMVISMVPLFALPIALLAGAERFRPMRALGLALGAGAIVLLTGPDSLPDRAVAGFVLVGALAPLCYALEGAYVANYGSRSAGPIQTLLGATVLALCIVVPVAVLTGQAVSPLRPWGLAEMAVFFSGVISTLAYAGYVALIRSAGAVFAAQVSYVVTGSGVIWAMVLLGERYSGWVWAALALLFVGLFLVQPRPPLAALARAGSDASGKA